MSSTHLQTFKKQIDSLVELLSPGKDSATIKENLLSSVFVDVRNKLLDSLSATEKSKLPEVMSILKSMEEISTEESAAEKTSELLEKSKQVVLSLGFDVENEFVLSSQSVLAEFIEGISTELSADQVTQVKKIISV